MEEFKGLAEIYYDRVMSGERSAYWMARLYWELNDLSPEANGVKIFGKLIKLFGPQIVFDSVLDMSNIQSVNHENIYPLIYKICKVNFDRKNTTVTTKPLDSIIKEMKKKVTVGRTRKLRAKDIDDE